EGGLQRVHAVLQLGELVTAHDDLVGRQVVGDGQLAGEVGLLATALAAIAPLAAHRGLIDHWCPAPATSGWFRHVTKLTPYRRPTADGRVGLARVSSAPSGE